jgi:mycothiol synthase
MAHGPRLYADETDYARMRALLVATYRDGGEPVYCTVGDLDWWRFTSSNPDAIRDVALWSAGDDVIGWAWPQGNQVDMVSHPHYRAVEDEMLAWAEQRLRDQAAADESVRLRIWSDTGDAMRNALLQRRGYQRTSEFFVYHSYALNRPVPAPRLPHGYTLRHVAGEADLEQRVAVHRDAFAPSKMTVAKHRAVMHAPTYRADLDLVVVAPDGSFAAYCIVWFDAENRMGLFEPVGCHSAHRRRGLGMAVLYEGMRRLQRLGAQTASVLSLRDDSAGALLYRAAGFHEVDRNYAWEKQL